MYCYHDNYFLHVIFLNFGNYYIIYIIKCKLFVILPYTSLNDIVYSNN